MPKHPLPPKSASVKESPSASPPPQQKSLLTRLNRGNKPNTSITFAVSDAISHSFKGWLSTEENDEVDIETPNAAENGNVPKTALLAKSKTASSSGLQVSLTKARTASSSAFVRGKTDRKATTIT
jgi:hypothetical protein